MALAVPCVGLLHLQRSKLLLFCDSEIFLDLQKVRWNFNGNFCAVISVILGHGVFHSYHLQDLTLPATVRSCIFRISVWSKVQCTLVQTLRLCTGRTAHRGCRGIALPFHDHGTRRGWGVSVTPRPLFTPGKDLVPIVQEAVWAPGPVRTGVENLAPTGFRSPDRPACILSLYRYATRPTM